MKLLFQDFKAGTAKVLVETPDDVWTLSSLIEQGDKVSGMTFRKVKTGAEGERGSDASRKRMFLAIIAEKIEYGAQQSSLRALGKIVDGPEDIARGEHHTLMIEPGVTVSITKPEWLAYHRERLNDSCKEQRSNVLICVLDREEAHFALLTRAGYDILSSIKGEIEKKTSYGMQGKPGAEGGFYGEIISALKSYDSRYNLSSIIIASPIFWKEELMKNLSDDKLAKKIVLASCSSCDPRAFNEILKRPEVRTALKEDRTAKELSLVDDLFVEISKGGKAAYGIDLCEKAAAAGAIQTLLVSDACVQRFREAGSAGRIDSLMRSAERARAAVHLISGQNDAGKRLEGIGGI